MQGEDILDLMLEEARKKPMKINHDFDARYRVWIEQIIPNRLDAIRQCGGDSDYTLRMVRLTVLDSQHLADRVYLEGRGHEDEYASYHFSDRVEWVYETLSTAIISYTNEVRK